jgi:hypothetical protein
MASGKARGILTSRYGGGIVELLNHLQRGLSYAYKTGSFIGLGLKTASKKKV